jgi:hypothetical protein
MLWLTQSKAFCKSQKMPSTIILLLSAFNYWFAIAKLVTQMCLNVTFLHTLPILLMSGFASQVTVLAKNYLL